MKRSITLIIITVLCAVSLFAQTPEKFSYQAVVRNASNALVTDAPVGIQISLMQGGVNGSIVFRETHTAITNANGLVTIAIGGGNLLEGSIVGIDWANGPYFLKTEIDPNGGSNYTISSEQQLLSVPYALYSKEAGNGFSGDYNDLTNRPQIPQTVGELANDANYITMDSVPAIPTNVSAFYNDVPYLTAEQQILSISHDTIFLTGGSFVKLPEGFSGNYNDLTNKPTIPQTVGELANDAGYITMDSVPTNVSAFNNDAGYLTNYNETDPQFNAWDKDYNDLINKPTIPTVPTDVSAFNNDAGYLTDYTETDPQFNAWDKDYNDLTNKPELFSGNYNDLTNKPNLFSGNYNDLTNKPTNADFGQGIVSTSVNNPAGATDIPVTFTGYSLENGGIVSLAFTRNVPAGATLNINNKGAKPIRWKGVALTDGIIKAGDRCLFMYNLGANSYYLLANDRWGVDIDALAAVARTGSYNDLTDRPTIPTVPTDVSAFNNDADYITLEQVPEQVNADWNATSGAAQILNKPILFSGNYNDLTNKPTNAYFGQGIVRTNVSNPVGATNIAVTFTNYSLETGGVVSLAFTNNVPAGATLNINNQGPKPIRWRGSALPAGIIKSNDRCLFMYNSGNESYYLLAIDRWGADIDALATVAHTGSYNDLTNKPILFSGNYNDLTNKPTIPTVPTDVSAFNNDAGYLTSYTETDPLFAAWGKNYNTLINKPNLATVATTGSYNDLTSKPNLATVATTGSYNDLTNKPTIPAAANNATLTIQRNGVSVGTFTANASTNNTINITVPTTTSELTNNSGYITSAQVQQAAGIPANVSAFNNDAGYLTSETDPLFTSWGKNYNTLNNKPNLAAVATSGNYNDLTNKPNLATVATTGSYNDLTNKPTIPAAANNAMLTIQRNYVNVGTFTANASANNTINISVPTMTSELTNNSGYITQTQLNTLLASMNNTIDSLRDRIEDLESGSPAQQQNIPTLTTSTPYNITATSAQCGGNITANGGSNITARGVCWSNAHVPTTTDPHTNNNTGTGSFSSSITGLSSGTTYYVRAYATNSTGTAYGDLKTFTTSTPSVTTDGSPCPGAATVTDYNGNVYPTVQIGQQCWMKKSLRSTHYANGTAITEGSGYSSSSTTAYYYAGTFSFDAGYLYNWKAVMRTSTSSQANPSGVQGICPTGWHVPSDAEWNQLYEYVNGKSSYRCSNTTENIAKALAANTGWNTSTNTCAVGNSQSSNNATGFSALPAGGGYSSSGNYTGGNVACFWSATEAVSGNAWCRSLSYNNALFSRGSTTKNSGYSVRCLRN